MARPLRLEYAGALYHITSRGDRQEDIFETDADRLSFLAVFDEVCSSFNWVCHAYCLMDNHYHLLVETPDANLSRGMRQLNGVYTQYFNRTHKRVGHVFQGRYKAIHVEKESYLLELCRYVVLNPVRARMVRKAGRWPWSSYRAMIGEAEIPGFLEPDWVLAAFGRRRSNAIQGYMRFVEEGKGQPSPWESLRNQVHLGSDEFVDKMLLAADDGRDLSEIPKSQRRAVPKSLHWYEKKGRSRNEGISLAWQSGGYSQREIGEHFGLSYSRVSRILAKQRGKT